MGDDHRVDVGGVAGQRLPVPAPEVRETLEEAAVDEDAGVVALDEELAAGHRAHPAQEPQQGRSGRHGARAGARGVGHVRPSFGR